MATRRTTCGALTKDGKPCGQVPLQGQTRCRYHGGASPRGVDHPHTLHGRYSRVLPTYMLKAYEDSLRDGNLIALRAELSLVDARIAELLSRDVKGNADSERWCDVMEAIDLRRRLAETERRRLVDAQRMISAEQVMTLVTALADAVRTHVTDADTVARVTREFARLIGKGATGSTFSADATDG